jgi:hypothetical protein
MRNLLLLIAALGVACTPPPGEPGPTAATAAPLEPADGGAKRLASASTSSSAGVEAASQCVDLSGVERLEVKVGAQARASIGIGVSFLGSEHDNFEDGHTDMLVNLSFHGIMDDGSLTPSAMTWRPSALAPPRWVPFQAMGFCARLVKSGTDDVIVEVARAPALARGAQKQ